MNKAAEGELGSERPERPIAPTSSGGAATRTAGGVSALHLYKPGQGTYVRWGTAIGIGIIAFGIAYACSEWLGDQNPWIQQSVPVLVMAALAYGTFWLVGQQKAVVDFLVATEGEMKKVNWSSWREVWGATKVVIVSVVSLGIMLCLVDLLFMFWFSAIGVLKTGGIGSFFKTQ